MRVALINPNWIFDGSIYFGCRDAHLPLEFGYSKALLEAAGHDAVIIDGQLDDLPMEEIVRRVKEHNPDYTVVTSAPSYLFWRCAPPELMCPQQVIDAVRPFAGKVVLVGPHSSTTPRAAIDKTGADFVILGECEEVILQLMDESPADIPSVGFYDGSNFVCGGIKHSANMQALPALQWSSDQLRRHKHHHHRFDIEPDGWGAEMETSRGCPYACSFCAKENFRNKYRKRPLPVILEEMDGLIAAGAKYVYFIDEIFLPNRELLEALCERDIKFGVQTRIDIWDHEMLDLLGRAGCVSIEAGVESITEEGRAELNKNCKVSTDDMTDRLIHARKSVAFVQGNLIQAGTDEEDAVEAWRERLQQANVWANKPVPLFPYPGSPDYTKRWGLPDDVAWERAHDAYLKAFDEFSDVQDARPLELNRLERPARRLSRGNDVSPSFRVLMTTDAVGGVWTYSMDLCRKFSRCGVQVKLAVLGPKMSSDQRSEAAAIHGLEIAEKEGSLEWMDDPWDSVDETGEWLLAVSDEFQPDIVHLNGYSYASLRWNAPVIVVAHSCVFSWWEAVLGGRPGSNFDEYFRRVKQGLSRADVVIAPTRAMLHEIKRHYDVQGDLRVIHNGRDLKTVAPGPRARQVFSAGRVWDQAKDFVLLDAVAEGLEADVMVAGAGAPEGDKAFQHLQVLGQLTPQEVSRHLTESAVFVSTARYEPFGLSILEAALHGCPLVLPDLDSLREIWQSDACYVDSRDPAAWCATIENLLDDEILRQSMAERAFCRGRQFTAERMAENYLRLYSEIAKRPIQASRAQEADPMRVPAHDEWSPVHEKGLTGRTAATVNRRP